MDLLSIGHQIQTVGGTVFFKFDNNPLFINKCQEIKISSDKLNGLLFRIK